VPLASVGANATQVIIYASGYTATNCSSLVPANITLSAAPALPAGATFTTRALANACLIVITPVTNTILRTYTASYVIPTGQRITGTTNAVVPSTSHSVPCLVENLVNGNNSVYPLAGPTTCSVASGSSCVAPEENMANLGNSCNANPTDLLQLHASIPTANPAACGFFGGGVNLAPQLVLGVMRLVIQAQYEFLCAPAATMGVLLDGAVGGSFGVGAHTVSWQLPSNSGSCTLTLTDTTIGVSTVLGHPTASGSQTVTFAADQHCHGERLTLQCPSSTVFMNATLNSPPTGC
jgi:hypothetical protein